MDMMSEFKCVERIKVGATDAAALGPSRNSPTATRTRKRCPGKKLLNGFTCLLDGKASPYSITERSVPELMPRFLAVSLQVT